jgi:hypothetical protein
MHIIPARRGWGRKRDLEASLALTHPEGMGQWMSMLFRVASVIRMCTSLAVALIPWTKLGEGRLLELGR